MIPVEVETNKSLKIVTEKTDIQKAPVKKDLIRTISFKSNQRLKFYIILSISHVLVIFMVYQTIHSFPNEWKLLPTKFCKSIICNTENHNVSSVIFDVYDDDDELFLWYG